MNNFNQISYARINTNKDYVNCFTKLINILYLNIHVLENLTKIIELIGVKVLRMADKSSLMIILVSSLIIMLTFRDLVRQTNTLDSNSEKSNFDENDEDSDGFDNKFDDFNDNANENTDKRGDLSEDNLEENNVKTIPSLKLMKTLNQQTLKFLFWYFDLILR